MTRPWRSLRGRATVAFATAMLLVSLVGSIAVWSAVSQYLLAQRERSTLGQVTANAFQLERSTASSLTEAQALAQLPREIGSTSLLVEDGEWWTTSLQVGSDDLPAALVETVVGGQPARQRIRVDGETVLAVGVPLPGLDHAYFEVFPLTELDSTYRILAAVLAATVVVVTLLALLLGRWVTAPALRPVARIAEAAQGFAAGNLGARMDPRGHRELEPIAALFNQAAAALERRVHADARFAADVSHELRNPLTTMVAAVSVLDQHREQLPDDGAEALALLTGEVERFARMVEDLLELSRDDAPEAGGPEDVRLAELARWALPAALRERLVVEDPEVVVRIQGDRRRLERAIVNLVDNAERHGGGLRAVVVAAGADGGRLMVDDAGPGVAEPDRERIFERFARAAGSRRGQGDGVGLGLSLVARHVQALGGRVAVEDSPYGGARFVVTLPQGGGRA